MDSEQKVIESGHLHEQEQHARQGWWLWVLVIFYGIELTLCTLARFGKLYHTSQGLFITEGILSLITVVFAIITFRHIRHIFTLKDFSWSKALVYGIASILFAILINMMIRWLNNSIFNQETMYFRAFRHLPYPRLGIIFFVAVLPAFFEELAYRGIILEGLFFLSEERRAVFLSAIFFAIIHMNFFSFFWLIPFAIWLGNVRWREGNIWYSVLMHFCFNLTACVYEF